MDRGITANCAVLLKTTAPNATASSELENAGGNVALHPDNSSVPVDVPTQARQAATAAAGGEIQNDEDPTTEAEIVFAGSGVDYTGYIAPTRTAIVSSIAFVDCATVNVAEVLYEFPSVQRKSASEDRGSANLRTKNANLRSPSLVQFLVLLNGMRLPAVKLPGSTAAGAAIFNLIPYDARPPTARMVLQVSST